MESANVQFREGERTSILLLLSSKTVAVRWTLPDASTVAEQIDGLESSSAVNAHDFGLLQRDIDRRFNRNDCCTVLEHIKNLCEQSSPLGERFDLLIRPVALASERELQFIRLTNIEHELIVHLSAFLCATRFQEPVAGFEEQSAPTVFALGALGGCFQKKYIVENGKSQDLEVLNLFRVPYRFRRLEPKKIFDINAVVARIAKEKAQ